MVGEFAGCGHALLWLKRLLRTKQTVISADKVAMMAYMVVKLGRNTSDQNTQPNEELSELAFSCRNRCSMSTISAA